MEEIKKDESKKLLQQQSTLISNEIDKKSGEKNKQQNNKTVIEKIDPINIFEDTDTELLDTPIVKVDELEENALVYDVIKRNAYVLANQKIRLNRGPDKGLGRRKFEKFKGIVPDVDYNLFTDKF